MQADDSNEGTLTRNQQRDIAPVAVFLASDEARLVTATTYDVTAGGGANCTA